MARFLFILLWSTSVFAGTDGSISGAIIDSDQIAVSAAHVQLFSSDNKLLKETTSDATGNFAFFPVNFGSYRIHVFADGYQATDSQTVLTSSSASTVQVQLSKLGEVKEIVLNVTAQKKLVQPSSSGSKKEVSHEQIENLPGGTNASLTKVISETTPGVVQGPTGQTFIRGNHANIQYQVDGVQLPDSVSGSFGDAFSTRNIDHMEVITGGIPAEYGERMAAVVNIVTKQGPEDPKGAVELNYGSYNTFNPQLNYGGSDTSGKLRYFVAASFLQTDRGIDTPQPASANDESHGGEDASHDQATGHDEFVRLDYQLDNENKFSLNLFNELRTYQMPTYPSSFNPKDPFFSSNYTNQFGGTTTDAGGPLYNWSPAATADSQFEQNAYIEAVWKTTLSDRSFLQVAPYYKRSALTFNNDPTDDLAAASVIPGSAPVSFAMDRTVNNYGLKVDHTWRVDDHNLFKSGLQISESRAAGQFSTQTSLNTAPSVFGTPDKGDTEAVYVQDSYTIIKPLVLNAGLRYSAIQFQSDLDPTQTDGLLQPRVGLEYMVTDLTKFHVFYGKLFTPAPFENLRAAFTPAGGSKPLPYDVKSEKDDYYEAGVSQQIGGNQLASLTYYYKDATNMLDDTQIPGTAIDQPYNFATGYATGVEFSISGELAPHLSEFFNYSYEDARGKSISGGFFAFPSNVPPDTYQFLDHCQLDTANLGLTYKTDSYWATLQGLYGSGLRTGPGNQLSLPSHVTFDISLGYVFTGDTWFSKWKTAFDVTNITDNAYPIFIANGFNGSHYAAGRQFFFRLTKEL